MSVVATDADQVWPMTSEFVLAMVERGLLEGEKVELIDGRLLTVAPQGPEHRHVGHRVRHVLEECYGRAFVDGQAPIAGSANHLPEPDVFVTVEPLVRYRERHPTGQECVLAVEVTKTTHIRDRRKASVYASMGIGTYWMIDLVARRIEVHTRIVDGERYGTVELVSGEDLVVFPGTEHSQTVASLLGD